jgi:hypothetical protein
MYISAEYNHKKELSNEFQRSEEMRNTDWRRVTAHNYSNKLNIQIKR